MAIPIKKQEEVYFKSIYNIINTLFEAIKKNVESSYNECYILFDNTFFKEFIE